MVFTQKWCSLDCMLLSLPSEGMWNGMQKSKVACIQCQILIASIATVCN